MIAGTTIRGLACFTDTEIRAELDWRIAMRKQGQCDYCGRMRSELLCRFPDRHHMAQDLPDQAEVKWETLIRQPPHTGNMQWGFAGAVRIQVNHKNNAWIADVPALTLMSIPPFGKAASEHFVLKGGGPDLADCQRQAARAAARLQKAVALYMLTGEVPPL